MSGDESATKNTDFVYANGQLIGGGGYDLYTYFPGNPVAGAEDIIDIVRNLEVNATDPGLGVCDSPPDEDAVFTITKNGVLAGNFTFPAGAVNATPNFDTNLTVTAGDTIRLTAPSPQVTGIENVRVVLKTQ